MAKKQLSEEELKAKVDNYIETKTDDFSRPICEKIRSIYLACGLKEEFKWGGPCYSHHGLVCSIGAFKKHVGAWFFQGALLSDPEQIMQKAQDNTKALRSIKYTSLEELNEVVLEKYVKEAMLLNEKGIKVDFKKDRKELILPDELLKLLNKNDKARENFQKFSYSKQKEYIEHISTAKREETRVKRLVKSIAQIEQGIGLHDKYKNC